MIVGRLSSPKNCLTQLVIQLRFNSQVRLWRLKVFVTRVVGEFWKLRQTQFTPEKYQLSRSVRSRLASKLLSFSARICTPEQCDRAFSSVRSLARCNCWFRAHPVASQKPGSYANVHKVGSTGYATAPEVSLDISVQFCVQGSAPHRSDTGRWPTGSPVLRACDIQFSFWSIIFWANYIYATLR